MTAVQLSNANPDGTKLGQSATDKVSFYGATPVVQGAVITAVATTGATASSPVGFTTTNQANAIVTALNSVITRLNTVGLIATA